MAKTKRRSTGIGNPVAESLQLENAALRSELEDARSEITWLYDKLFRALDSMTVIDRHRAVGMEVWTRVKTYETHGRWGEKGEGD